MIIRIVKMQFREEEVDAFRKLFEERRMLIRHFEGCQHLELWQDQNHASTFFTYSWWDTQEHLERYRQSHFSTKPGTSPNRSSRPNRKPGP